MKYMVTALEFFHCLWQIRKTKSDMLSQFSGQQVHVSLSWDNSCSSVMISVYPNNIIFLFLRSWWKIRIPPILHVRFAYSVQHLRFLPWWFGDFSRSIRTDKYLPVVKVVQILYLLTTCVQDWVFCIFLPTIKHVLLVEMQKILYSENVQNIFQIRNRKSK